MEMTAPQKPALAGALCPNCGATCVFEVPEAARIEGAQTVGISCHECNHAFDASIAEFAATKGGNIPDAEDEAPWPVQSNTVKAPAAPPASRPQFGRLLGISLACMAGVAAVGGITYITLEYLNAPNTTAPQVGLTSFAVQQSDYTIETSATGDMLDVTVTLINTGAVSGRPQGVSITLLDSSGNTLMAWPINPGGIDINPNASLTVTSKLVEPPEGIADMKVMVF